MPDKTTLEFILGALALIIVYDLWTLMKRGYDTTISWTLFKLSQTWPIIPFAFGVIAGHLFFPNRAAM